MSAEFDILVVGSGPSAVMAADTFLKAGHKVGMLDAGLESEVPAVPPVPFSEFTQVPHVETIEAMILSQVRRDTTAAGQQLTPPRAHVYAQTDTVLPIASDSFFPLQSLAKGGLSAAWGAATFTYTSGELAKMGLPDLSAYYEKVADKIGVSGPQASRFCAISAKQAPLILDDNASLILKKYQQQANGARPSSLYVEQASLAILSEEKEGRQANPYEDTDFWHNPGGNTFRADFWVDRLKTQYPQFHYLPKRVVVKFSESPDEVLVEVRQIQDQVHQQYRARKLILCAGCLNSYRLVAASLAMFEQKNPLLCNPYLYVPSVHLAMLGKKGRDQRYSLAQLFAGMPLAEGSEDCLSIQSYSYRSLWLHRLMLETPLPRWAARWWWRLLVESLVIFGVHYPVAFDARNTVSLARPSTPQDWPLLRCQHVPQDFPGIFKILRALASLGCLPMGVVKTKAGASIHYAGTLPNKGLVSAQQAAITTEPDNARLSATRHVHVLDSSTWGFLPAKGLTMTIMANSLRLAERIVIEMGS